jgi:hypothetical protein
MQPKSLRALLAFPCTVILFIASSPFGRTQALDQHVQDKNLPALETFVNELRNGQSGEVRGVYIPEIMAAPVIHQPEGNNQFVSANKNTLTQFDLASQFGSSGFLAHNYLAGQSFSLLEINQIFYLIYGDGQTSMLTVTEILRYQALEPASTFSEFIDLQNNHHMTTAETFLKVYDRPGQIILQTCIAMGDVSSWGRLFVIAEPFSD